VITVSGASLLYNKTRKKIEKNKCITTRPQTNLSEIKVFKKERLNEFYLLLATIILDRNAHKFYHNRHVTFFPPL